MKRVITPVVFLIILSVLPLVSLFVPGLPKTHDGIDHVARIANFYRSLTEGIIVPRWAANLNWGYGHPILMFLYPFSSYAASVFHWIGFSLVDSVKLVFGFSYVASAVAMYAFLTKITKKREALIGSLLYAYAPYRFVDLYVRGALGEHVAFVFPPLVFLSIMQLSESGSKRAHIVTSILLSVSVAGLVLSHNAIALMFLPIAGVFAITIIPRAVQKIAYSASVFVGVLFGFALSAFFWIPAFFEGKYTLRDIVTAGESLSRFVDWRMFVYSPWVYAGGEQLSKFFGFAQWIGVIAAVYILVRAKKDSSRKMILFMLLVLVGAVFLMTPVSAAVWRKITLLQKFQFPWRFLSVCVFSISVIGALSLPRVADSVLYLFGLRGSTAKRWATLLLVAAIILPTIRMWRPVSYVNNHESFYTGIYLSTTDTGESSPIWSVRFMEHTSAQPSEVISGAATITEGPRTSTMRRYTIVSEGPARILENTLFFPGWKVYIDGVSTGLQWQDPAYRGLITYRVTEGKHDILVRFEDTKLRAMSNTVSFISFGLLAVSGVGLLVWRKKS